MTRLKHFVYFTNYCRLTDRTFDPEVATVDRIAECYNNAQHVKAQTKDGNADYPKAFTTAKRAREHLDDMKSWIENSYGLELVPLPYLIRNESEPPIINPEVGMPTYRDDMIRMAPHDSGNYNADNTTLWLMIRNVTHGTDAYAFVRTFSRTRNGRGAMHALTLQFFGVAHVDRITLTAERSLETLFWNGKARNFSFDGFISKMQEAFTDLEEYGEGRSEMAKVRTLLKAIRDPKLQEAKAVVSGLAEYRNNFESAHNFLNGQLALRQNIQQDTRNIASTETYRGRGRGRGRGRNNGGGRNHGGRGRGGRGNNTTNSGRYSTSGQFLNNGFYSAEVWNNFTSEEQQHIRDLWDARPTRQVAALNTNNVTTTANENNNGGGSGTNNANSGDTMTRRQQPQR